MTQDRCAFLFLSIILYVASVLVCNTVFLNRSLCCFSNFVLKISLIRWCDNTFECKRKFVNSKCDFLVVHCCIFFSKKRTRWLGMTILCQFCEYFVAFKWVFRSAVNVVFDWWENTPAFVFQVMFLSNWKESLSVHFWLLVLYTYINRMLLKGLYVIVTEQ